MHVVERSAVHVYITQQVGHIGDEWVLSEGVPTFSGDGVGDVERCAVDVDGIVQIREAVLVHQICNTAAIV